MVSSFRKELPVKSRQRGFHHGQVGPKLWRLVVTLIASAYGALGSLCDSLNLQSHTARGVTIIIPIL